MSNEQPSPIQQPAVPTPDYFTPDTHTVAATDPGLPPVAVQRQRKAVRPIATALAVIATTVVAGATVGFYTLGTGPNLLQRAVDKCNIGTLSDNNRTLLFDMAGKEFGSGTGSLENLQCLWTGLDLPTSTQTKMMETRALDGRQSDSWKASDGTRLSASWSYHPDNGLDVIFELAD